LKVGDIFSVDNGTSWWKVSGLSSHTDPEVTDVGITATLYSGAVKPGLQVVGVENYDNTDIVLLDTDGE
jgi:hypothetical protein